MDMINKRPGLAALVAFIAGLLIGLVVLGWWLFPVQFTGADPAALLPQYQAAYIRNAAELYSFDNNQEKLRSSLSGWGGDALACELAQASADPGDRARLVAAATIVNGQGCTGPVSYTHLDVYKRQVLQLRRRGQRDHRPGRRTRGAELLGHRPRAGRHRSRPGRAGSYPEYV